MATPINPRGELATQVIDTVDSLVGIIANYSIDAGWQEEIQTLYAVQALNDDPELTKLLDSAIRSHMAEQLMLIVTEVAEAMEVLRHEPDVTKTWYKVQLGYSNSEQPPTEFAKPEGIASELADVIIRVLDFAGTYKIDISLMLIEKINSNIARGYRHGDKLV